MAKQLRRTVFILLVMSVSITAKRLNVLFLVSDDMRPEIGAYQGTDYPTKTHPKMHTPNLDSLAKRSLVLKHAYVQQAVCSPSRTSLLTGRRPDTTRVHDLTQYWRNTAGNFTTIPQYFKENGYLTLGMGKIFHPGSASGNDDPVSWSEPNWQPDDSYWAVRAPETWHAAAVEETRKHPLMDTQTSRHTLRTLETIAPRVKSGELNFFVAVGFHKPHLPFLFPEEFLKYYPEEDIRLPDNAFAPVNLPEVAWSFFDELRWYPDIQSKYGHGYMNTTLPDVLVKQLRRAYYSALSYTDSLIGEVTQKLEELGLENDTIISFWGDHGWQLGEHGEWCKQTNFELTTHAPMMVRIPGMTDNGPKTERLTEFVDLFPTLVEAAGLPPLQLCPEDSRRVSTCTEGLSMLPLIANPKMPWKSGAFSQYPRMLMEGDVVMGYRLRTPSYSYTEWVLYDTVKYRPVWDNIYSHAAELYDHKIDSEENVNRANDPKYRQVQKRLSRQLRAGWRNALDNVEI